MSQAPQTQSTEDVEFRHPQLARDIIAVMERAGQLGELEVADHLLDALRTLSAQSSRKSN